MFSEKQVQIAAKHFVIAAEWADKPENTHPRIAASARATAEKLVRDFNAAHPALCERVVTTKGYGDSFAQDFGGQRRSEWPYAAFGHDLYLTIAGHGTGFWDRECLDALGDEITAACQDIAYHVEVDFFRGWMYIHRPADTVCA